ncbi:ATP-binding protein [Foetidibacter luteolus]|uniref:ATP-binding protein n=1 Tax=Foetidibacter luteolus TaxID=2608880 RepID=UPI00129B6793|nr:HAMP domain-containing sensor histidine kinase [Foetidibacter luteolus]
MKATARILYAACILAILPYACGNKSQINHPEILAPFLRMADTASNQSKDHILVLLDSAYETINSPGPADRFSLDSFKRDYYGYVKTEHWKAMQYADTMIEMNKDNLDDEAFAERYARALVYKGLSYYSLRRFDDAYKYYTMSKEVLVKYIKNKCTLAQYSGTQANLLFAQGKYVQAATEFVEHYRFQLNCGQENYQWLMSLQGALDNAGICYFKAGLLDSAYSCYKAALETIEKNEHRFPPNPASTANAKGVIYGNQAEILAFYRKFKEAEELYIKSIAGTRLSDVGYTQFTQMRLAQMYITARQLPRANNILQATGASLDTLPDEQNRLRWFMAQADYYKAKNDAAQASEYLRKFIALKDTSILKTQKFAELDVRRSFESMEQKVLNETLQRDNQQKSVYLLIAVVVICMALAIVALVWYNLRRTGRYVKQLNDKNDELQKAFNSLESSHNENSRIMRVVAHDLKNPASAMRNLVHSLLRKEESAEKREILELIQGSCINSLNLINDLLTDKKQAADARKEVTDLSRLLENCVELHQAKADEKSQRLQLRSEQAEARVNTQRIWRVISNIINNAIKFSPENAVIDIRLQKKERFVQLCVKDYGIGIPANLKDKIFSLPEEAGRQGTMGEESYGLGLSISKKIVEEHQGKIWFESVDGKGSSFYVELPALN